MSDKLVVNAQKISQSFQVGDERIDVLKELTFSISEGTFNIIYGPSGSGKSTLLNILTGLQKPSSGTVNFSGDNPYELRPNDLARFRANQIGFMYQQNFWVKGLNVLENVALPLHFLGYDRKKAKPIALETLRRVGMEKYAKKYPPFLSGGEQQRIAFARALVNSPLFIIADEPTGSLDSKNGDMIMNLLRDYRNAGKTVILVTHNMEYLPMADRLIHITDGSIENFEHEDIEVTTKKLMQTMQDRIDALLQDRKKSA